MPSTCEFQLNNSNAVYYSGDIVSGAIVLKTSFAKDVRGKYYYLQLYIKQISVINFGTHVSKIIYIRHNKIQPWIFYTIILRSLYGFKKEMRAWLDLFVVIDFLSNRD